MRLVKKVENGDRVQSFSKFTLVGCLVFALSLFFTATSATYFLVVGAFAVGLHPQVRTARLPSGEMALLGLDSSIAIICLLAVVLSSLLSIWLANRIALSEGAVTFSGRRPMWKNLYIVLMALVGAACFAVLELSFFITHNIFG